MRVYWTTLLPFVESCKQGSDFHSFMCLLFSKATFIEFFNFQGPVVQNIVSLMSSLVVRMWNVLVLVQYLIHSDFCWKNIRENAIFNDQSFYDTLTNDIISFEQMGPVSYKILFRRTLGAVLTGSTLFPQACLSTVWIFRANTVNWMAVTLIR